MSLPPPADRPRCHALVPCAGNGQRAGPGGPKQYRRVAGRSVVAHTLAALAQVPRLVQTVVVLSPDDVAFEHHAEGHAAKAARVGGASRAASVAGGLDELRRRGAHDDDWVLVHDAARCLLRPADVERLIDACEHDDVGGLLALPLADTLKRAAEASDGLPAGGANDAIGGTVPDRAADHAAPAGEAGDSQGHRVAATLDRRGLWQAQTPQMFRLGLLRRALAEAGEAVTDEASAIEHLGLAPKLVPGSLENFKLTWPADFELAARLLGAGR